LLIAVCLLSFPAKAQYGGGTGEPNNPYLIYTAEQMNTIGAEPDDWDKHFTLMADINLGSYTGTDFNIIGYWIDWSSPDNRPFAGVFDGNGYTISNFTCNPGRKSRVGLFGYVEGKDARIKDLGLIDPYIDAGKDVGSLVGRMRTGTITGCYVSGGSVAGGSFVGGLVGVQDNGAITNCYATASVSGDTYVGGLVGYNNPGCRISDCYSTGRISGKEYVGGLVGLNRGAVTNCYANGSVSGSKIVGGFAGSNGWPLLPIARPYPPGGITNCYSTGSVPGGNHAGGLVGRQGYGRVTSSFWDIQTSGQTTSDGGIGKTTAEMQMAGTFVGWGCELTVWTIDEGVDYPGLAWENKPGSPLPILSEFLAGSGTQTEPYLIHTTQELGMIGQFPCEWSKHFKLMADIDLSDFTARGFNVIGDWRPFTGVFDGSAHTISNFSYTSTEVEYSGLFSHVGEWGADAHIKDLGLIDPNVDAGPGICAGALVGRLHYGTITGCYARRGNVSGHIYTCVGGLVGRVDRGTVSNCYSSVGVKGGSCVGGLVGDNYRGTITKCYSVGGVSGDDPVGGLVGDDLKGTVKDSFWDIQTSGQAASAGGTGKTTAEMQMESTFTDAGWDFVEETANGTEDIWWILEGREGRDYPRLWWELIPEN
jgi:hypothetical protein